MRLFSLLKNYAYETVPGIFAWLRAEYVDGEEFENDLTRIKAKCQ